MTLTGLPQYIWQLTGNGEQLSSDIALYIQANPQELIDALVEAGVLERRNMDGSSCDPAFDCYRVVQPHKHEWHKIGAWLDGVDGDLWLRRECRSCKKTNASVIEVPE